MPLPYRSHYRCITAICRQIEAELPADMTDITDRSESFGFYLKRSLSRASPVDCFNIRALFLPQKASAAQSQGGKRRGRPKKEVRISAESVLLFV